MLYTACHQHQLSCRAESDVHAQCPLRVLAHLLYELQRYICILVGHKRLTWSYSAFGKLQGQLGSFNVKCADSWLCPLQQVCPPLNGDAALLQMY